MSFPLPPKSKFGYWPRKTPDYSQNQSGSKIIYYYYHLPLTTFPDLYMHADNKYRCIYMYKKRKKQHSKQKSGVHTDKGQHRTEEYQKTKEEETEG